MSSIPLFQTSSCLFQQIAQYAGQSFVNFRGEKTLVSEHLCLERGKKIAVMMNPSVLHDKTFVREFYVVLKNKPIKVNLVRLELLFNAFSK